MAEVYTISGALGMTPLSATARLLSPGAATAAAGHAQAPSTAASSAPTRSAPLRLQNGLKALGNLHGDSTLTKIGVDGIIGAKTVKAVNYAIAQKYVVMPSFPRPELTLQHVRQYAAGIASAIESAVKAGGGSFPLIKTPSSSVAALVRSGGATLPLDVATPETDRKWVWWVVGGVSVLVVLSLAARAVRGGKSKRKRVRDDDED